jgi:hypothetical protein
MGELIFSWGILEMVFIDLTIAKSLPIDFALHCACVCIVDLLLIKPGALAGIFGNSSMHKLLRKDMEAPLSLPSGYSRAGSLCWIIRVSVFQS